MDYIKGIIIFFIIIHSFWFIEDPSGFNLGRLSFFIVLFVCNKIWQNKKHKNVKEDKMEDKKQNNKWKKIGIIFIILFVIETIGLIYLFSAGTDMVEKENECAVNICREYNTYYYDMYEEMCYCYENHEVVYSEYMR